MAGMVGTLKVNAERARQAAGDYILATDIADYLVKRGTPFREAHRVVGKLVGYALEQGKTFQQLSLGEYRSFCPIFEEDVYAITVDSSVRARDEVGGTAPHQVEMALKRAKEIVEAKGG
jgi:argininosuccinate lyase